MSDGILLSCASVIQFQKLQGWQYSKHDQEFYNIIIVNSIIIIFLIINIFGHLHISSVMVS